MKKVAFEDLVPGKEYYVKCGIWSGNCCFVGAVPYGSRFKYRFTYGPANNWINQYGLFAFKSNLTVYEKEK